MNSIWTSLIWKEWNEHKWKFVALLAVLCGTSTIPIMFAERDVFSSAYAFLTICLVPLAIFMGVGSAASERSRGTLAYLQSLPVPTWKVAIVKLAFGLLALLVPVLLTVGYFYLAATLRDTTQPNFAGEFTIANRESFTGAWALDAIVIGSAVAASLYLWSAAAGVNRKDEVSAGALALVVMIGYWLVLFAIGYVITMTPVNDLSEEQASQMPLVTALRWIISCVLATAPVGVMAAAEFSNHHGGSTVQLAVAISVGIAAHLVLATLYVRRFGRTTNTFTHSPRPAARSTSQPAWLPPRGSAISAIAWKQLRESGPLVLAGLAGVVAVVAIAFVADPNTMLHGNSFAKFFAGATVAVGYAIAIIVGIGICLYDVSPKISTFWRSRPINVDLWFWSKYVTGLLVLLAALYLPVIFVICLTHPNPREFLTSSESHMMPFLHAAMFAAAAAMTCIVRNAVYAAILSVAVVYLGVLTIIGAQNLTAIVGWTAAPAHWLEPSEALISCGFAFSFATSTILAWLAMRYDWGSKRG